MPQIIAWQSSYTKEVFTEKSKYELHNRRQAAARRARNKDLLERKAFSDWLAAEKENICSVDEIAPWILLNQRKLMDMSNKYGYFSFNDKFFNDDEFTEIEIYQANYSKSVSNTHSCPHNGVTNWRGDTKLADGTPAPNGYPGWSANIKGSLARNKSRMGAYPYGGVLKLIKLHTGTGGGGNNWRYDCKIFLADWPGLSTQLVVNKLTTGKLI